MALGAPMLGQFLSLPTSLLFAAGLILVPYAGLVAYLGTRARLQPSAVWTLIVCNVLWGIDCVIVAVSGWVEPTTLGYAFILIQVVVVAAFAELQYVGLRRATATA
jgi:Na+-translocating ferredoxin:NAD+ oxidoreductase RnfA subunit